MYSFDRVLFTMTAAVLAVLTVGSAAAQDPRSPEAIKEAQRKETARLLEIVKSDSLTAEKAAAMEQLAVFGTSEAIGVLVPMLADEKLSHYARFSLEPIPDPAVDEAFRKALDELQGDLLIGVINSIGNRRDEAAVEPLSKRLADGDPKLAAASAAALGQIANAEATDALIEALANGPAANRAEIADGCLRCAQHASKDGDVQNATLIFDKVRAADVPKNIRLAGLRGAILIRKISGIPLMVSQLHDEDPDVVDVALRTAREVAGKEVVQALSASVESLPSKTAALVILTIGDLGDPAALPIVVAAAKSGSTAVRLAAFRSLKKIGNATVVPVLWEAALESDQPVAETAQATLAALPGEKTDAAVVARLDSDNVTSRKLAIELIGRRRTSSAIPQLFEIVQGSDDQLRLSAIGAIGETAALANLPTLINWVIRARNDKEKAVTQLALKAACVRMPDRDACAEQLTSRLGSAPPEAKTVLLEQLGSMGGPVALECLAQSAKDSSPFTQDAATRILGEWVGSDVAPVLLELARTLENNKYKIRVTRGYIRIANQFGLPHEQKMDMCEKALAVAQRDEEKELVLGVLGRDPSPVSLRLAISQLDNTNLKEKAAVTAVSIAQRAIQHDPKVVAAAMDQVIQSDVSGATKRRAEEFLQQATKGQ